MAGLAAVALALVLLALALAPPRSQPLVGLHNLLNYWRYTFDGSFEPAAMMGHMRFESL